MSAADIWILVGVTVAAAAATAITEWLVARAARQPTEPAGPPAGALLPVDTAALDMLADLLVAEAMADVDPGLIAEFMRRGQRHT